MREIYPADMINDYVKKIGYHPTAIEAVLNSGVSSSVYKLSFDASESLFLKVSSDETLDYTMQKYVVTLLTEHGVKIPEIVLVDNARNTFATDVLLMKPLEGESALDPSILENIDSIAKQVATINSLQIRGFGLIHIEGKELVGEFSNYKEYFSVFFDRYSKELITNNVIESEVVEKILDSVSPLLAGSEKLTVGRLIHGDLPGHIFVKDAQYSGIIDFDDIRSSMPYYDVLEAGYYWEKEVSSQFVQKWETLMDLKEFEPYKELERLLFFIEETCLVFGTFLEYKKVKDQKNDERLVDTLRKIALG